MSFHRNIKTDIRSAMFVTHFCLKEQNRILSKVVTNMNMCSGHLTNCATEYVIICTQTITTYNLQGVITCHWHVCHRIGMFAIFLAWLPHCGHDCNIFAIIATLWPCLPCFEYDCHTGTVSMLARFRAWLPHYMYISHVFSMIATLWPCLLCFDCECHTEGMFATF